MRVRLLDQYSGVQIGSVLAELPADQSVTEIAVVSAFVKQHGVLQLGHAVRGLLANNGTATLFAGVDHNGTSRQGLEEARKVFSNVLVVHDRNPAITFHPKLYLFRRERSATIITGSSNLTAGGLYTNRELNFRIDLDSEEGNDRSLLRDIVAWLEQLRTLGRTLDAELMQRLEQCGMLCDEERLREERRARAGNLATGEPELFQASPTPPLGRRVKRTRRSPASGNLTVPLFWKKLSNWDVSTTSSPNQVQIPKRFVNHFPPLGRSSKPTQREVSIPLRFYYEDGSVADLSGARFIEYTPHEDHPRPNIEYRLALHNRTVLESLNAGDVLVFLGRPNSSEVVAVRHVPAGSSAYGDFPGRFDEV